MSSATGYVLDHCPREGRVTFQEIHHRRTSEDQHRSGLQSHSASRIWSAVEDGYIVEAFARPEYVQYLFTPSRGEFEYLHPPAFDYEEASARFPFHKYHLSGIVLSPDNDAREGLKSRFI